MDEKARYRWIADHILPLEPGVRRWLHRICALSSDDIDDLIQEAYARLWGVDFTVIRNARRYLYSTVHNVLTDQLRRARVVRIDCIEDVASLRIDDELGPERRVSARQQFELLVQVILRLSPQRRCVFEARQFEGLSIRAIAERMHITEKTVQKHLYAALTQVAQEMFCERDVPVPTSKRGSHEADRNRRRH